VDVYVSLEVYFVLFSRHQEAVSCLGFAFLLTVAVATSNHQYDKDSGRASVGGDENNGFNITSWVVVTLYRVSGQVVSLILHADLPGGSAVSGVPGIQEAVRGRVATKRNVNTNRTDNRLLITNADEEVVTGV